MSQLTEHLARIPLLAGCSSRDLELLGRAADQITLRGGSTLTRQGDIGREAFVLLDGTRVYQLSDQARAREFAGTRVKVVGVLDGASETIRVTSIAAE